MLRADRFSWMNGFYGDFLLGERERGSSRLVSPLVGVIWYTHTNLNLTESNNVLINKNDLT